MLHLVICNFTFQKINRRQKRGGLALSKTLNLDLNSDFNSQTKEGPEIVDIPVL